MSKVKVIDAIMGQGKTTWAIQYMKDNPNKRFIFVTPFLDEVKRVLKEVPNSVEPLVKSKAGGKLESLKSLTDVGRNIITTHALMSRFDKEVLENIRLGGYTLILDEVTDVLEQFDFGTKDNQNIFFKTLGYIGKDKYICWKGEDEFSADEFDKDSFFSEMIPLCENKQIIKIGTNKVSFIKEFPINIFQSFSEVYVLTYMFEGSIQKPYFELKGIEYEYLGLENGKIVPYKPTSREVKQELKSLMHIVTRDTLNEVGNNPYAFSSNWCKKHIVPNSVVADRIRKNTTNFFRNICKDLKEGKGDSVNMVSTFKGEGDKSYFDIIKEKGWSTKDKVFIAFNIKATNKFVHKKNLAYLVNIFPHSPITMYFNEYGDGKIKINEDAYALSLLIQWIWRSRIRNQSLLKEEREINLYLPSKRMREILIKWLDSE